MTDRPVADATQRARALALDTSFIVQAPAGSGKTELLSQRYLNLLSVVDHPEEIYAITFTRKAAAEMRNRVLSALDMAAGPEPAQPHRRLTWKLARAALLQDERKGWRISANPNRLRIQTFDSLSHGLARQMPLLSELGAPPATTENAEPHYREAARTTLRQLEDPQLGPHIERLLVHLDNRQGLLEDLLCNMLGRRDQWLWLAVASPDGTEVDNALEDAVCGHLQQLQQQCPSTWLHRLMQVARHAAGNIDASAGKLDDGIGAWCERAQVPGGSWADLPAWRGLARLLLTTQGSLRKSWDSRIGFLKPSETGIAAEQKRQRQQAKAEIAELTAELIDQAELIEGWKGVLSLPLQGLDAQQQVVLRSLFQVLLHAVGELQLVFRDSGEVDFSEIQMRAQRALGDPDHPTDLALTLDYRLRHLLVDEFQDTSISQYRLIETLSAGWHGKDGRTLFLVGDPMQSIYRFREAEVGNFLAARERGIGQLSLEPITLQVNFRSTADIVGWVNRSFGRILPQRADISRGAVPYESALAYDDSVDAAAVQIHPFAERDDAAEAQRVVALIRQALDASAEGQIAVLARARSHLHPIALALKTAGLGFQAVEVDPLGQQAVVQDLHHLTRALLHPADRLAWLVVLRAPWLGLDIDDLLAISETSARCIPARLRDPQLRDSLSNDGQRRVERLLRALDQQLPARGRRPLRQWVEAVWLRLGGLAAAGGDALTDAQAYLGLLERHEQAAGLIDFAELESALDRLYAAPDGLSDGRIQLMTMHKSKGLEFDTVILPGLGRQPRSSGSELLYWLERPGSDTQRQLLMAPIRAAEQRSEAISDYLRELEKDRDRLETARLLYVAATRAKRRLHLLGHVSFDKKGKANRARDSLLDKLWPTVGDVFDTLQPPAQDTTVEIPVTPLELTRLRADWRPAEIAGEGLPHSVPRDDFAAPIDFEWASDTARHVGTLVHRHLERIAIQGVEHWPVERVDAAASVVRRGLRNLGVVDAELDGAVEKALRALRLMLADDTGRWILAPHKEAACEWPLTLHDETAQHYVIDRTFVDERDVRWIIDYKTGEHLDGDRAAFLDREQERYRTQLETYGRIVRQLDPRPIRLALYFPLFADWRVWDY